MKKQLIILFLVISWLGSSACRFTVREIGFSILSQDIYTLVVLDVNANAGDNFWKNYHEKNRDCNLHLEVLNPRTDVEHPIVINAKQMGIQFPATVLVAPDGRIFQFQGNDISKIYAGILESELGTNLQTVFPEVFAAVIWIKGEDETKNQLAKVKVQQECAAIENIMPGMPKVVKKGPIEVAITKNDFQKEKLFLWSLGIDSIPKEPLAFVLYGRGRIIGEALNYQQILDGGLYKYMSMIGADCECGLDKKWMLGNQVLLLWDKNTRQFLAKLLGFDVDNPMILAEMSRILAKESLSDETGSVAFAPETIDLDKAFGISETEQTLTEHQEIRNNSGRILIYTLIAIVAVILLFGFYIIFNRKNRY